MRPIKLMLIIILCLTIGQPALAADTEAFYTRSEPWVFTVAHQVTVENPTGESIRGVRLTIPLMDTSQPVYQELLGEEFAPWPDKIVRSSSGTRQGIFIIPEIKPGQKIVLTQRYAVRNYAIQFHLTPVQVSDDYSGSESFLSRYLLPETGIESKEPAIIQYARDVVKGETNPLLMAEKLFADINLFMTYKNGVNANKGALNAIRTGEGVCEDYTDLFVAAARSLGIPARWKSGYLYLTKEYTEFPYIREDGSLDISRMRHTWPEFYLPKIGWVVLDPTFTYFIRSGSGDEKAVDWNKFANIESASRHIFFSYGSQDNDLIEYTPKSGPQVSFSESMQFGNSVFPFRDAVSHWAKDSIRLLTSYSPPVIGGYGNGLFGPNDLITRAQLAAMLNRALTLDYNVAKPQFSDVPAGYWAYADIAAAKGAGIVGGYPDGTFRPDQPVTRAELAAILTRAFDLEYPAAGMTFRDLGQAGYAWADSSIVTLAGNGIAGGFPGGYFYPERNVTRGEFAAFLARVLDRSLRLPIR